MKVLVATKQKQGIRKNDFSHTNEDELVKFGFECDGESVDGECGCKRSFCGFETSKATTTAKIVNKNITKDDYIKLLKKALNKEGWLQGMTEAEVQDIAEELLSIADKFNLNDIIEKRGNKIQVRK